MSLPSNDRKVPKSVCFLSLDHWRSALSAVEMAIDHNCDILAVIDPTGLMKKMFELRGKFDVEYFKSADLMCFIDWQRKVRPDASICVIADASDGNAWRSSMYDLMSLHPSINIDALASHRTKCDLVKVLNKDVGSGRIDKLIAVVPCTNGKDDKPVPQNETIMLISDFVVFLPNERVDESGVSLLPATTLTSIVVRSKLGKLGRRRVLQHLVPGMLDTDNNLHIDLHPILTLPEIADRRSV